METFENKVSRQGKSLITNLHILVRMTGIYDSMNEAVTNAARRLAADLEMLLGDTGEITLKIIEGSFYVEGIRVKAGVSDIENFSSLADELKKRSIGMFDFKSPVGPEDLITLAYAIKGGNEVSDVQTVLEGKLTQGIALGGPVFLQKDEGVDLKDDRAMAKRAYLKALALIREMDKGVKSGTRIKLKRIKRALQLIVDCILTDESHLLGYTLAKSSGNYYYQHAVNVSILAAALGKRVGFNRVQLRTLTMAAFFHDAGKAEIPLSILNKKTDFTSVEQELIMRHPIDGVKVILRSFGLNETSILSMLVSYEHHMKPDGSGYPYLAEKRGINIFSRIVGITDDFDSLASGMVYGRKRYGTAEALKLMSEKSGSVYDPPLLKALAGIFQ